jgi:hypothetical protein
MGVRGLAQPRGQELRHVVDQQLDRVGGHRRVRVEGHVHVPGVQGVLAEAQPDQPDRVQAHAEERQRDGRELVVGQLLQQLDGAGVGDQGVGRLLVGGLGVPHVPHRLEALRAGRLALAQRTGQHQRGDLGAAADVRQDLGHAPLGVIGLGADLLGRQRPGQLGQPVVRATYGGDPLARV